jgi:hypothetical protein
VKEYFANLALHNSDVTINLAQNHVDTRKVILTQLDEYMAAQ